MSSFGGSIKLTGEDAYKKALSQITQNLREVSSAMTLTTAQYNNSDKSLTELNKAQKELSNSYSKQLAEVEKLRSAYTSFSQKVQTQAQAHQKLVDNYNKEKAELDKLEKTVGTTSQKYQDQKAKVESLAQEVAKSTRNNDSNAQALSKMGTALNKAETELVKTEKEMKSLGDVTEETTKDVKSAGDGFTVFKGILANLGTQAINSAINGLKSLGGSLISVGKQAISSYADYEQLVGGVETLFKDSAGIVQNYANEAYKTAGLSANQYMETVTSFSASLLQSLDGDTQKASEYSNRAIIDMSDNANKMGTSMESIQNAYQGFAKQNYTMLDNLKLGYGGTKTEMQRLIKDASALTDVQKELGITVDANDMSFGNIVNAISVVQKEMGIMGTTSKEASTTISGSINSMKSAWSNLLTGIADDNADFGKLIDNFVESIVTVAGNLIPRIKTVLGGVGNLIRELAERLLPEVSSIIIDLAGSIMNDVPAILRHLINAVTEVIQGLVQMMPTFAPLLGQAVIYIVQALLENIPALIDGGIKLILGLLKGMKDGLVEIIAEVPNIIKSIVNTLVKNLPDIIKTGIEILQALITGLLTAIPDLVAMLPDIITTIIDTLTDNLPLIIDMGIELLLSLIDGIIEALPQLIAQIPLIIDKLVSAISNNLPKIIQAGVTLIIKLAEGLIKATPQLIAQIPSIVSSILKGFSSGLSGIFDIGKNLIKGLWNGISEMKNWVLNKIKGFGSSILNGIKSIFGIHSPSTVFRDQIGKNLALGLGEGFSDEMNAVTKEMENSIPTNFSTTVNSNGQVGSSIGGAYTIDSMILAFQEALASMKIELDDEEAGRFVRKTVEQAIYT